MRINVKPSTGSDLLASAGYRLPLVNRTLDTVIGRAVSEYLTRRRTAYHILLRDLAVGSGVPHILDETGSLSEVADGG